MYRRIAPETFDRVVALSQSGATVREIALTTGISQGTVKRWRQRGRPRARPITAEIARTVAEALDRPSYAYLLGMYLGDGNIAALPRTFALRISFDPKYPGVIDECAVAFERLAHNEVKRFRRDNVVILASHWQGWPILFPQHGPGRKHLRQIELDRWQREITHENAKDFLRGLIRSDGSRCMNRFSIKLAGGRRRYGYPRYFFTNVSDDIRGLFCEHCELLGIRWTQSNWKNISVSHRDSVALLDDFVGPKA